MTSLLDSLFLIIFFLNLHTSSSQVSDVCDAGYYGSQCTDECHCLNDAPCDNVTGECPQRQCAAGYRVYGDGLHCQVCRGETYGLGCSEKCHCSESRCVKTTGHCNSGCYMNWVQPDCQTGITRIERGEKVNPYQPTSFTCYIHGDPLPDISYVGFRGPGVSLNNGVTRSSVVANGTEMVVVFDVERVIPDGDYACKLSLGAISPFLDIKADTYDLPVMGDDYLVATKINSTAVSLNWEPWFAGIDPGNRPLVAYIIYYRDQTKRWVEGSRVRVGASTTSIILNELDVDTVYEFSIAAVREGPGGEGPRTPGVLTTAPVRSLSKAAIIGICVGLACFILLIPCFLACYYRRKTTRHLGTGSTSIIKYSATRPQPI